jgi:F-type H+-transporting ATPase subunit a
MAGGHSPMEQFSVKPVLQQEPLFQLFGQDIYFTNASLWMILTVLAATALFTLPVRAGGIVPGRLQSIAELLYEFVAKIVIDMIGEQGMRYFPLVFSLFGFILFANMLGMMPYSFTVTSHIIVTFALAMLVFTLVILVGLWHNGFGFFKLFLPSGVPLWLAPIIVPIEIVSFLSRPVTLSVRLFANMLAGHTMLKVFAGFVVTFVGAGGAWSALAIAPLLGAVAVTALEFLIAFLQAYVFAVLTCIYINDALHASDH